MRPWTARMSAFLIFAFLVSLTVFGASAWYALEADPNIVLTLELDRKTPGPSTAQVYWSRRGPMREEESFRFDTHPGVGTYAVSVPVDTRALRLDPLETPGIVHVWRIVLQTHGVPIKQWGGNRGFAGWTAVNELVKFEVRDRVLTMESIGRDPWMEFRGLEDLRAERRPIHQWLSVSVATLCAGLNIGLTWLALRAGRGRAAGD